MRAIERAQELLRGIPPLVNKVPRKVKIGVSAVAAVILATTVAGTLAAANGPSTQDTAFSEQQALVMRIGADREKRSEYLQELNQRVDAASKQIAAERAAAAEAARIAAEEAARAQAEAEAAAAAAAAQTPSGNSGSRSRTYSMPAIPADCGGYGGNKAVGCAVLGEFGFGIDQMGCLETLWNHESGWNEYATNPSSGAYGIPQALPASKMATFGDDWQTNPATQIRWGLNYIANRYGSPCGAWSFWQSNNWY